MRATVRSLLIVLAVVAATAVVVSAIVVFLAPRGPLPLPGGEPQAEEPLPTWAPPPAPPTKASGPGKGVAGRVDPEWVAEASAATGIPERALAAYAGVALAKAAEMPACGLSWATLAGIGAVESDHGRHGGNVLDEKGTARPGIFGVALDGVGVALIPDSDDGRIDGDPELDRAVGPMQFIPEAWRNWNVDGNGDGTMDPQNIDDATLAAANYLCRASTAYDTEEGWAAGVRAYNSATTYAGTVARFAIRFAEAVG